MSRRKRLTFWGADEDDDSLGRAVIAGFKTVTADTVEDYYKPYGEYGDGSYETGDLIEVYDLRQRLRCLIRANNVLTIRLATSQRKYGEAKGLQVHVSSRMFTPAVFLNTNYMMTSYSLPCILNSSRW